MHECMNIMIENADAFVALPGGFGTLEEIFQIASWAQLNIHKKPIGVLNVNGFYDRLFSFLIMLWNKDSSYERHARFS
ncbi:hypothetical protein REPUB_Repub20aG0100600 [Reevesia pubescens]